MPKYLYLQFYKHQYKHTNMLLKHLLKIVLVLSIVSCKKDKQEQNPFENETMLDCRNLKIRKVTYSQFLNIPPTIHVSIENTCRSCSDNWVYLGLLMIDKTTRDTVAWTCRSCLSGVKNKTIVVYELETSLTGLPDLKSIRFDYSYLCHDVSYEPK